MVFYDFDTTFSKNLIEFFNFVFNCRFYSVFLVVWDIPNNNLVSLVFYRRKYELIFWYWKIADIFHDLENNCSNPKKKTD